MTQSLYDEISWVLQKAPIGVPVTDMAQPLVDAVHRAGYIHPDFAPEPNLRRALEVLTEAGFYVSKDVPEERHALRYDAVRVHSDGHVQFVGYQRDTIDEIADFCRRATESSLALRAGIAQATNVPEHLLGSVDYRVVALVDVTPKEDQS